MSNLWRTSRMLRALGEFSLLARVRIWGVATCDATMPSDLYAFIRTTDPPPSDPSVRVVRFQSLNPRFLIPINPQLLTPMQFTLYYRGDLKANGKPKHKQEIRRVFHSQLKDLWQHHPLKDKHHLWAQEPEHGDVSVVRSHRGFRFAPLVCESLHLVAELSILMLWPAKPGAILSSGGDIDNRLKTLFDALKYPSEENAIPKDDTPQPGEDPFFCLVEDDSLITRLSVETDRLLERVNSPSEVALFIRVQTRSIRAIYANAGLG